MFEKYLNLLDTLKRKKFSRLLHSIRQKILTTLNSEHFSPKLREYLASINTEGEPFTDFSNETEQVSQVKKIINALYHAELALQDLETVNLRDGDRKVQDLTLLYNHTVHQIYQAAYLITHLDINVTELFSQELAKLVPIFQEFHRYAQSCTEETTQLLQQFAHAQLPRKVGVISGIVVDQLQPQSGELDYEFLTQFTAVIPSYLDQLSHYIKQFSARVSAHEPTIDKRQLEELQNDALELLNSLRSLEGGSFFLSVKALHYIRIIRRSIALILSILEQVDHFSESTQDVIRDNLAELKYKLLPALFGLSDKIEEQAMLRPGTLSQPLMARFNQIYPLLIEYTEKVVDFSQKGEELLTIEDGEFIALRLNQTYRRMAEYNQKIFKIEEARQAAKKFFAILKKPQYQGKRLSELPDEPTKRLLATHYKLMQPYMLRMDMAVNNDMIRSLTESKGFLDRWTGRFRNCMDRVKTVLARESSLTALLDKERVSCEFHRQLNIEIIDSVSYDQTDLKLFPYPMDRNVDAVDEASVLSVDEESSPLTFESTDDNNLLMNPERLTSSQAIELYQFYEEKSMKLKAAQQAWKDFCELLCLDGNPPLLVNVQDELKIKLRNLYGVLQPYLVCALRNHPQEVDYDQAIVAALSAKPHLSANISLADMLRLNQLVCDYFRVADERLQDRRAKFAVRARCLMYQELADKPLVVDHRSGRVRYVIKHTEYSKAIHNVKGSLLQLTAVFNAAIRRQLRPSEEGIPFPEADELQTALGQSSQVLILKRLFNGLYHLEQIAVELERLNDDSTEINYVRHICRAGEHIHQTIHLAREIATDPYLALLGEDVLQNLQRSYAMVAEMVKPYEPESVESELSDQSSRKVGVLYALNALMILPEHIQVLHRRQTLSSSKVRAAHERSEEVAADIQRIIERSNSYFKLFLEIPTMYRLFRDLKRKLSELATTSHAEVLDHLEDIQNDLLPNILLETDQWEDKLGLTPGTLSSDMKMVLDEFYKGLLEPLDLDSNRHVSLVTSLLPIDKRLKAAQKRMHLAKFEQDRIREKQDILKRLSDCIDTYKEYAHSPTPDRIILNHLRSSMVEAFIQARPILISEKDHFELESFPIEKGSQMLDDLLNDAVDSAPKLQHIETLTKTTISYFKGLGASHQLVIETASEKIDYLEKFKEEQRQSNGQFIEDYTQKVFKKQVGAFSTKPFGLIHCGKEYQQKLKSYLQSKKDEIVLIAQDDEDIKKKVGELLRKHIQQFEREHYQDYYHLETIQAAIAQFKLYLHESNLAIQRNKSLFESEATLRQKNELILQLEEEACHEDGPVQERIDNIKDLVSNPTFKTKMLAYHHYDGFTFSWLKQFILSFFELLGLYTPKYKKSYAKLVHSVEEAPDVTQLSARFGLFSRPTTRGYDLSGTSLVCDP